MTLNKEKTMNNKSELIYAFWIIYTAFTGPAFALAIGDLIAARLNNAYDVNWALIAIGAGIGFFLGFYNLVKWSIIQAHLKLKDYEEKEGK